jgi:hypothetical protein
LFSSAQTHETPKVSPKRPSYFVWGKSSLKSNRQAQCGLRGEVDIPRQRRYRENFMVVPPVGIEMPRPPDFLFRPAIGHLVKQRDAVGLGP